MELLKRLQQRPLPAILVFIVLLASVGYLFFRLNPSVSSLPNFGSGHAPANPARPTALPLGTSVALASESSSAIAGQAGDRQLPATLATPRPSATITPTPTITPSPTATLPPAQLLALGIQRQRLGDYDAAKAFFAELQSGPPGGVEGALAFYHAGEIALDVGKYAEAKTDLNTALQYQLPAPESSRASYLIGTTDERLGQWADAVEAYRHYLTLADPVMNGPVQERIARAELRQGAPVEAAAAYAVALEQSPDAQTAFRLREVLASTATARKLYAVAISQYQAILAQAELPAYRAEIEDDLGNAYEAAGQDDLAVQHWHLALDADPTGAWAYRALVSLVDGDHAVDDFQRGVVNVNNQSWRAGAAALERYLQTDPAGKDGQAQFYLGKAYDALDRYPECYDTLDTLIQQYPQSPKWAEAWLAKAAAQASPGGADPAGARVTLLQFAQTYPQQPLAVKARWQAASLAEQQQNWSTAAAEFRELQATYPNNRTYAAQALFRAGLAAFRGNDHSAAADAWSTAASQYPESEWGRAARLWQGKLRLASGAPAEAQSLWADLINSAQADFYSERARTLAAAAQLVVSTPAPLVPLLPEQEQDQAESWLRSWVPGLPAQGSLAALDAQISNDAQYRQGVELWALNRRSEAVNRLDSVRVRLNTNPLAQYQLALALRDMGAYRQSIQAATRLQELSPAKNLPDLPVLVQKLLYPSYYSELIEQEAQARGLDPWLVFAVIRQESLFEDTAISSASAHGLMQVIPDTGTWIAQQLRWPNYQIADLSRPYISIKFGTFYLAYALKMFDGNVFSGLAGYNAGPGNARIWRNQLGTDDDIFALLIPSNEAKIYVERITAYYAVYRRLYTTR